MAEWGSPDAAAKLAYVHETAKAQCMEKVERDKLRAACNTRHCQSQLGSGGWCLSNAQRKLHNNKVTLNYPGYAGFAAGGKSHAFVAELDMFLRGSTQSSPMSINDFGAGLGQLGDALIELDRRHHYHAWDGAGNVVDMSGGDVAYAELTVCAGLAPILFPLATEADCLHNTEAYNGLRITSNPVATTDAPLTTSRGFRRFPRSWRALAA